MPQRTAVEIREVIEAARALNTRIQLEGDPEDQSSLSSFVEPLYMMNLDELERREKEGLIEDPEVRKREIDQLLKED